MDSLANYFKSPKWRTQQKWRRAIWNLFARTGLTGMHALPVHRAWVDIHRHRMSLQNLDPANAGLRLIQVSDLHLSPVVWQKYLVQYIGLINELKPDVVVVTGDLITGGYRYAHRIATILSHLRAPLGIICTFGNHDYSIYGKSKPIEGERRADYLEKCLKDRGLTVLRNQTIHISRPGAKTPVAIVGLDDEWSHHLDAQTAWQGVDANVPIICLNHNPANCPELMEYPWQWMLSGHTHGRQVATSRFGRRFYPNRYRLFTQGYYQINGRHLYVNRGLSYGQRIENWCRPEITVFRLDHATATAESPAASGDGNDQMSGLQHEP